MSEGAALLEIDRFALTANNVTYAAVGKVLGYWDFFPAEDNWGCVPVWGFANVAESRCEGLAAGERVFGYMPMASHLVVRPARVGDHGFVDGTPHRADLPSIYNRYARVAPSDGGAEDKHMIFYPLFVTSFLMQDFFADNDYFGARRVVVSSASSKTAIGFAYSLGRAKPPRPRLIGLTSRANREFVSGLGHYDEVVRYEDLGSLAATDPTVFVDIAGNASVRTSVHRHFGENVVYSCAVGTSHWDKFERTGDLPGAKPTFFFAPEQAVKRREDWGAAEFETRIRKQMAEWFETMTWLELRRGHGPDETGQMYLDL